MLAFGFFGLTDRAFCKTFISCSISFTKDILFQGLAEQWLITFGHHPSVVCPLLPLTLVTSKWKNLCFIPNQSRSEKKKSLKGQKNQKTI